MRFEVACICSQSDWHEHAQTRRMPCPDNVLVLIFNLVEHSRFKAALCRLWSAQQAHTMRVSGVPGRASQRVGCLGGC